MNKLLSILCPCGVVFNLNYRIKIKTSGGGQMCSTAVQDHCNHSVTQFDVADRLGRSLDVAPGIKL